MKVGKVLAAKNNHEGALQAYTNALNELSSEKFPEKSQREILALYCLQYMNLDEKYKCKHFESFNSWILIIKFYVI